VALVDGRPVVVEMLAFEVLNAPLPTVGLVTLAAIVRPLTVGARQVAVVTGALGTVTSGTVVALDVRSPGQVVHEVRDAATAPLVFLAHRAPKQSDDRSR